MESTLQPSAWATINFTDTDKTISMKIIWDLRQNWIVDRKLQYETVTGKIVIILLAIDKYILIPLTG